MSLIKAQRSTEDHQQCCVICCKWFLQHFTKKQLERVFLMNEKNASLVQTKNDIDPARLYVWQTGFSQFIMVHVGVSKLGKTLSTLLKRV